MAINQVYKLSSGFVENFLGQDDIEISNFKTRSIVGIKMSETDHPYQGSRQGPDWGGPGKNINKDSEWKGSKAGVRRVAMVKTQAS